MHEIVKRDENLASKIIKSYSDMMFAGVVAGNNPGRVWADELENPTSALVWSEGLQCFQFMGSNINQTFYTGLKTFINDIIIDYLLEKGLNFFEFSTDTEGWFPAIFNALSDRQIKENWQYVYRPRLDLQDDVEIILPEPFCLHLVNRSFISAVRNDKTVSNPEFLIDYIEQFWGSTEKYLNLGYGSAAVDNDKIVSFAITSFLYGDTFSIGVETLEQYRRKGLASTLVRNLLKSIYAKGFNVWWDCMDSNIASQKTAESAGLILDHKYKVCWFNF